MHHRWMIIAVLLAVSGVPVRAAETEVKDIEVDSGQVSTWNRFARDVYALHQMQIANRKLRLEKTSAAYPGVAARGHAYTETSYYDARSGLLLSRVRTERGHPDRLHIIEVYVHDAQGHLQRDYTAIYLPWAHNAPIRTMINLQRTSGDLHAFRQFDASGERIFEQCRGQFGGKQIDIQLYNEDISATAATSEIYRACFEGIPETAGIYLKPQ